MIAEHTRTIEPGAEVSLIEQDARCGRDWALAVRAAKGVTVTATLHWVGGARVIAAVTTLSAEPVAVDLPPRLPGRTLVITASSPTRAKVDLTLAWTPDCACHIDPVPAVCR